MKKGYTVGELLVVIVFFLGIAFGVGAWLNTYTINTWLAYAGKPPDFHWVYGGLLGIIPGFGQICIPAAVLTWIAMMFLI